MDNHMSLSNNALATRTNYLRGVQHLMMQLGKLPQDCSFDELKGFLVGIPNPRIAKYHTEILDREELHRLFAACRDIRQLLIVQLPFDTGMRSGKLLRLELKDFDKTNRAITLRRGKGQKLRVIPYGEHIRTTLKAYVKIWATYLKQSSLMSYKEKGLLCCINSMVFVFITHASSTIFFLNRHGMYSINWVGINNDSGHRRLLL